MSVESKSKIAVLNDQYRTSGTNFMLTNGVLQLGNTAVILDIVRKYSNFNASNDPYGEHDFGAFSLNGEDIYWKIDYYDNDPKYGGKIPSDPACKRVLTVLLASEY